MADPVATLRAVTRRRTVGDPPPCPPADGWRELLACTPPECHPWIGARATARFGDAVPVDARRALQTAARGGRIAALHRAALLKRVAPALDRAGITFLILKGAALAYVAYEDPAHRTMGDLDIWTRAEDLPRALAVFERAGFRPHPSIAERSRAWAAAMATQVLVAPGSPLVVELHGRLNSLTGCWPGWTDRAWTRCERRRLGDVTANVLHPEDALTHLVIHGGRTHELQRGLRALIDVRVLLEREGHRIGWSELASDWRREGLGAWALVILALASDLLDAPVPPDVIVASREDPAAAALVAAAGAHLVTRDATLPPGVRRFVVSTPRARTRWLLTRFTTRYLLGPAGARRRPGEALREALFRVRYDATTRMARYVRGLLSGALRGAELRRRTDLAIAHQQLISRIRAFEAAAARPPDSDPALDRRAG